MDLNKSTNSGSMIDGLMLKWAHHRFQASENPVELSDLGDELNMMP